MNRKIRVLRCFPVMGILILGLTLGMTCKKKNQPPGAPSIPSGPVSGSKGDSLRFSTLAEDPDGDSVAVRFDWGDSTRSDWSALVPGGDTVTMMHAWQKLRTYSIRAQARDTQKIASVWSPERQLTLTSFFAGLGGAEGVSVQQTSDGGYIITGTTGSPSTGDDVYLVKTDESGDKMWDKTFGGPNGDQGRSVQQTSDGGYVVVGYTWSFGAGQADVWLIKTDGSGNKVWDKTLGGPGYDVGSSVQQTADGGYVITGLTSGSGPGDGGVWLVKTDADGDRVWDKTFAGTSEFFGHSVQQTRDGGYILAGYIVPEGRHDTDVWLIRTDASGNKTWDKTFGGVGDEDGRSVQQTRDGGYVIAGWTKSYGAGGENVWLVRVDASGNEVWDRTFGEMYDDEGWSVRQARDGGYVVAGYVVPFGAACDDAWLIKTDSSGNEVWNRTFGGPLEDYGYSVQQTSDDGFIIGGCTDDDGRGGNGVLLIKTDADGN